MGTDFDAVIINCKIIAVDAVGSVLFGGPPLKRLIPGHGAGVPSQFLHANKIYDHVYVDDVDCARGCWSLLEKEAILSTERERERST